VKAIFFNSSMPRAGSTLLQNVLAANPEIYATPTSDLLSMLNATKKVYTTSPVFKAQDPKQMRSAFLHFCRSGMEGYFQGLTDRPYIIDKCRGWAINRNFLSAFYPNPKIICMVRDLREILASMEKNYRKHPDKWDPGTDQNTDTRVTVGQRVAGWMREKPVGATLQTLKEVFHRGYDKDILFVRFEDFCSNPALEMSRIYSYLGLPSYDHDYQNIVQTTEEDDRFHGRYGDHTISPEIHPIRQRAQELLGARLSKIIFEKNSWYFEKFQYQH
jgi:sulfotransferase